MAFAIRLAEAIDWPSVRDLLDGAGLPTGDLDEARMIDFLVAESTLGDVIGAIGVEPCGSSGLLRSLVISPDARDAGLGRALIERLEAGAAAKGVTELWLLTTDAEPFFARIGYTVRKKDEAPNEIRATREFSSLCPASAVLMSRPIRR